MRKFKGSEESFRHLSKVASLLLPHLPSVSRRVLSPSQAIRGSRCHPLRACSSRGWEADCDVKELKYCKTFLQEETGDLKYLLQTSGRGGEKESLGHDLAAIHS